MGLTTCNKWPSRSTVPLIGPLKVVDDEEQRAARRRSLDQIGRAEVQVQTAFVRLLRRVVDQRPQQRRQVADRAQRGGQRKVGHRCVLITGRSKHRDLGLEAHDVGREAIEQAGLAHPGLTAATPMRGPTSIASSSHACSAPSSFDRPTNGSSPAMRH